MWSKGFGKIVLIDYGLAKFIKESVHEQSKTFFRGTPGNVGEEMMYVYDFC